MTKTNFCTWYRCKYKFRREITSFFKTSSMPCILVTYMHLQDQYYFCLLKLFIFDLRYSYNFCSILNGEINTLHSYYNSLIFKNRAETLKWLWKIIWQSFRMRYTYASDCNRVVLLRYLFESAYYLAVLYALISWINSGRIYAFLMK